MSGLINNWMRFGVFEVIMREVRNDLREVCGSL